MKAGVRSLRYGVHVPAFDEPRRLLDMAVRAEERGWDGCFFWDHVLGSREMALPVVDPWVLLGAVAAATTRIRIGTAVTPLPRRRPQVVARQVVTLDRLSGGRAVLGAGLGSPLDAEYGAFGEPTDPRVLAEMLDESLEVLDGLWTARPFSHAGAHYQVREAIFVPPPLQPRIPVWVACTWPHRRPLRRAARRDGVIIAKTSASGEVDAVDLEEVGDVVTLLIALGIDASTYDVAVVGPGLPADPAGYERAGATWWLATGWLEQLEELIDRGTPAGHRPEGRVACQTARLR